MRKLSLLVLFTSSALFAFTQDETIKQLKAEASKTIKKDEHDTTGKVWKKGGMFSLNIAQGSLSNWQGGGDKFSFSAVGFFNTFVFYQRGKNSWDNTLDVGYGYLRSTSLGSRKSDDRLNLTSKYGHLISEKWKIGGLFDLRTQFSKGYNYSKDASGRDVRELTSNFFAPGYILLSLGFDYKPSSSFSLFISPITERYIIVADDSLAAKGAYGVSAGEHKRNELGAFLSAVFNKEIGTNVTYKSKLDAFSNYKNKPGNVDIFWNNILAMKVSRNLSTNIIVDLLYDDNAIARLQLRELLAIGITVKF
jgi:hypothetical protein